MSRVLSATNFQILILLSQLFVAAPGEEVTFATVVIKNLLEEDLVSL